MPVAKNGEVSLTYRRDDRSYAVILTTEQHQLLQLLVPALGRLVVPKNTEVDFVNPAFAKLLTDES